MARAEPEKVVRRSGQGVVVRGDDIDTDRIIPARYMRTVTFAGLEDHVFADARFTSDGTPKDHPFNDRRFADASLLLVNRNFGCGSSREHAPQALARWGIHAVVGESFAEIFFGNCVALGVPAVTASKGDMAELMDSVELDPSQELVLDLQAMTLSSRAGTVRVELPPGERQQLVEGSWDATRTLLQVQDEIRRTAQTLPYVSGFGSGD